MPGRRPVRVAGGGAVAELNCPHGPRFCRAQKTRPAGRSISGRRLGRQQCTRAQSDRGHRLAGLCRAQTRGDGGHRQKIADGLRLHLAACGCPSRAPRRPADVSIDDTRPDASVFPPPSCSLQLDKRSPYTPRTTPCLPAIPPYTPRSLCDQQRSDIVPPARGGSESEPHVLATTWRPARSAQRHSHRVDALLDLARPLYTNPSHRLGTDSPTSPDPGRRHDPPP